MNAPRDASAIVMYGRSDRWLDLKIINKKQLRSLLEQRNFDPLFRGPIDFFIIWTAILKLFIVLFLTFF